MSAHTQGRWYVEQGEGWKEDYPRHVTIRAQVRDGVSYELAVLSGVTDQTMPNARLMALAPELLAKLKAIVQRYEELLGRDCTKHDFQCCVSSAEDVLAKLEGGA